MRSLFFAALIACAPACAFAQEPTVAALFREMPDSLMPYLTKNNRLDMLDFMEARMKAEVTNRFDGKSEMTALSSDSLTVRLSDALTVDMRLERVAEPVDSSLYTVSLRRTYHLNESQTERVVDVYTSAWRRLSSRQESSSLLSRDAAVFARPQR